MEIQEKNIGLIQIEKINEEKFRVTCWIENEAYPEFFQEFADDMWSTFIPLEKTVNYL